MELLYILIVLFLLTQVGDVYSTIKALSIGKVEKNPLMRWVIKTFGNGGFIAVKAVCAAIIVGLCLLLPFQIAVLVLVCLNAVYIYIVYCNFKLIRR